MSEKIPKPAAANAPGLAFVRPLPRPQTGSEGADVATRIRAFSVPDRLFPARDVEAAHGPPPVKGLQLGHFTIEERIGRGGMGSVFRAIDVRLERVVALKVLAPDFANDYEAVQRFRNEARAAARLDHNHIARVHFIGEEHGLHFIAFEYVFGTTLRQRIEADTVLPEPLVVSCALQIASALRHTAAHQVVHRDIKPSNLLLMTNGRVKLVDLGLARDFNRETPSDLTVAGTALGTFDYISPEQALDARNVDVRSDIYSLGCTLFHMITGSPPYPQGTMMQKVVQHHQRVPPEAIQLRPGISPRFSGVIRQMMSSDPDERYATPDDLITDLLVVAAELELEPVTSESLVWSAPEPRASRKWISAARVWLAVISLLAAAVLLDRWQWGIAPENQPAVIPAPAPDVGTALRPPLAPRGEARTPPGENQSGRVPVIAPPASGEWGQGEFVIVAPNTSTRLRRPTLAAACQAAPSNSLIEIHSSSDILVREPLQIVNKNLRIRAAGTRRPRLRFELTPRAESFPTVRSDAMIQVSRGLLELADLDVELLAGSDAGGGTSLFGLEAGGRITGSGVLITIDNPGRTAANIIHVAPMEVVGASAGASNRDELRSSIILTDSFCRGEADFLWQNSVRDTHVQLENVAIACSGQLFRIDSAQEGAQAGDAGTTISLDHVTAFVGTALLTSRAGERGQTPRVEVQASDSVFCQEQVGQPFITLRGPEDLSALQARLRWRATRDASYYQLSGPVCQLQSTRDGLPELLELALEDFGANSGQIVEDNVLKLGPRTDSRGWHVLSAASLTLNATPRNPALAPAEDSLPAGVNWKSPRMPQPEVRESGSFPTSPRE